MQTESIEKLAAWQRARMLVNAVYDCVSVGAGKRDFGYRDQICRASVSAMTNIAEGYARTSRAEFKRILDIARASAREVQSLLYIGRDRKYIDDDQFAHIHQLAGMTATIIGKLMRAISS